MACCGKDICGGCFMQNWDTHATLEKAEICVLCRTDTHSFGSDGTSESILAQYMKLVKDGSKLCSAWQSSTLMVNME